MMRVTFSAWLRNSFACVVVLAAGGLLYVKSMPASADPAGLHSVKEMSGISDIKIPDVRAGQRSNDDPDAQPTDEPMGDIEALELLVLHLEKGHRSLTNSTGYTAKMYRQERVNGELLDEEIMKIKVKHAPFSIFMDWIVGSDGQEVLYVDGMHDGNMIVKPGGFGGRFLSALELDPHGDMAMKNSRHAITEAGLLNLTDEMLRNRRLDIEDGTVKCRKVNGQSFNNRPCLCFVVEFPSPNYLDDYRKSVVFMDQETSMPVLVKNYAWPADDATISDEDLDAETLIESYAYSQIRMDQLFTAADFDRFNEQYNLQ